MGYENHAEYKKAWELYEEYYDELAQKHGYEDYADYEQSVL